MCVLTRSLPEAPLAFSQAENELLSAKEVPPAFTLPDKVLSSRGGSSCSRLRACLLLFPCCQEWARLLFPLLTWSFLGPQVRNPFRVFPCRTLLWSSGKARRFSRFQSGPGSRLFLSPRGFRSLFSGVAGRMWIRRRFGGCSGGSPSR